MNVSLPGGAMGFLIVVNIFIFFLAFFLDFFEIAFIVVPMLGPVADKMGIDLIWFGVILAMNLQTSFLTPPFGFALFYLRSVAAKKDYNDRITGERIPAVTTAQIYKGSIAFIILQLIMVAVVVLNPGLVSGGIAKVEQIDVDKALEDAAPPPLDEPTEPEGLPDPVAASEPAEGDAPAEAENDPAKQLELEMKREAEAKKP